MFTPNYSYPWLQPQQAQSNINWVQGESGAKSFAVAPGQSVLLMDSESNVFYIKSSDASGMPLPLRTFEYTERAVKQDKPTVDYITREEFEKRMEEVLNGKQPLSTAKPE